MTSEDTTARARRMVVQRLQSLQRAGVCVLPRVPSSENPTPGGRVASEAGDPPPARSAPATDPTSEPMADSLTQRTTLLATLQSEVARCTRCSELAASRTQTVFGVGNPRARLCFLGEAPGADEDRLGEPFVGRAGKLLTDIIEKGMRLQRSDFYILNVLKCRPPANRNPAADEVENCWGYLEQQLEIIQPEFICCLGSVAAHNLLNTNQSLGRLRGRIHDYQGIRVVVTYHPAYLLRNPSAKKATWQDIRLLMKEMDLPVPERGG